MPAEPFITKLPRKEPPHRKAIHPIVDLSGKRFGSWTLLLCTTPGKGMTETRYICRCDCGLQEEKQIHHILTGESESCKANCGRGKQIREHGILDSGQTPGSKIHNVERWQRTLEVRRAKGERTGPLPLRDVPSAKMILNDSQ